MERALLLQVRFTDARFRDSWPADSAAQELQELVRSSGVLPVETQVISRDRPSPRSFLGSGKVIEIYHQAHALKVNVVIFSEDLSPTQQRNLEEAIGVKVIDRTQLILDIFAQRAHSQEGKVQVELAQLQYLLPRLIGKGILLSRLGGGIGTRGPGEQKLEIDRRRIRLRIGRLKRELEEIRVRRENTRQKREEEKVPSVALIGYTNAGKSTLLNALTQAGTASENRLFTTLDPITRRLLLPNRQEMLLSDTVGFLHHLPHHLIDAFRATLEEVIGSDLLLHVVDLSHPMRHEQMDAVEEVLELLEVKRKPRILVFNKVDQVTPGELHQALKADPEAVALSAKTGRGLEVLLQRLISILSQFTQEATIRMGEGDHYWMERIYSQGQVLKQSVRKNTLILTARVPHRLYGQLVKAGLIR